MPMLNARRLAVVLDLDETLFLACTMGDYVGRTARLAEAMRNENATEKERASFRAEMARWVGSHETAETARWVGLAQWETCTRSEPDDGRCKWESHCGTHPPVL